MKFYNHILLCLALNCVWAFTFLAPVSAQTTFKAIPLDCGGWFSGFAQAEDTRLYGYGDVFGAWRSDDGGNSWTYLNWGIPEFSIFGQAIAVQRNNANVVFYQTNTALYKSTDGGSTWSKKLGDIGIGNQGAPFNRGSSPILIKSDNPNEIWLAAPRKNQTGTLWRSTDGGDNWAKAGGAAFDSNPAISLHNVPAYPNQIWVGSSGGLFVSTNGGGSFTLIGSASSLANVGMISRFTSGVHAGIGLVTRSNNNGGGISRITATDFNNPGTYTITDSATFNLYFGYPTGLQIFSDGTSSAWNTSGDRHGFSTDGGQLFTVRGTTLNTSVVPIWTTAARMQAAGHPDYGTDQVIEAVGNPNKWLITGGGAPMYSLDKGLSWQYFPNNNGLAGVKSWVANVSRFSTNIMYVPAADIGSAIITDGGLSGQAAFSSSKTVPFLHNAQKIMEGPNTQDLFIAGTDQVQNRSTLLRSTNGGSSWTELNLASSGLDASRDGIVKAVMSFTDANDFLVVLASGTGADGTITPGTINPGVWRTLNGGATFNKVQDLPQATLNTGHRYNAQVSFIDRDATQSNVRYFVARDTTLYRSTNGGSNWTTATHPFPTGNGFDWAWAFVADPIRSNNLWSAGDYRGVVVSRDGGLSWAPTAQYFNARHVSSCDGKIAVYGKASGDTVDRFYYSTNDGASFTAITDSSKNFDGVNGVTVDRNGKIWVSWNSVTVITPSAALTAPAITSQPASQTVNAGSTASFTFTVSGNPTPALFWQRSASGSSTFTNLSAGGAYSGVSSGTLSVAGTTTTMSGDRFRAVAINSQGSATSEAATLTVNATGGNINRATGGTATTSSTNSPGNETVAQAFDGNTATKWLTFSSSGWIQYTFGGGASWNIVRYAITSANDAPERDPRNWQLEGSNNGTNWTTVDTRSAQTFSARFQRREFTVASPGTFTSYRLNITANQSGSVLQLAELQLYTGAAPL